MNKGCKIFFLRYTLISYFIFKLIINKFFAINEFKIHVSSQRQETTFHVCTSNTLYRNFTGFIIRHVSLNIIAKLIIPNLKILTKTRTQDGFSNFLPYFLQACRETNNFGLSAISLSCLVFELQELSSPGIEIRILFWSFYHLCSFPGLKE
jgi:hypothetical protein